MTTRILIGLSVGVAIVVGISIHELDHERLSALGSIISGAGSLLAVVWFSAGLRYQSKQLDEQRKQFAAQFEYLQETSRRDALMLAKDILDRAEEKATAHHGSISSTNELATEYTQFEELKPILESTNPHEVIRAYQNWMKKEGAALILLNGIKSAAEVYLRSIGSTGIDYSKSPEDFYFIYSPHFATLPFLTPSRVPPPSFQNSWCVLRQGAMPRLSRSSPQTPKASRRRLSRWTSCALILRSTSKMDTHFRQLPMISNPKFEPTGANNRAGTSAPRWATAVTYTLNTALIRRSNPLTLKLFPETCT